MEMGPTQRERERDNSEEKEIHPVLFLQVLLLLRDSWKQGSQYTHTHTTQNWRGIENGDTEKGNDEEMGSLQYDERKTQQHTQTWSTKQNKVNRRDRSRATTGERERER
jgi:hypothetical protein